MGKMISSLLVLLLLAATTASAQIRGNSGLDGVLRSNGRIYVVVAVMTVILIGLFLYLIRLDRKITKLEKEK